MEMNSDIKTEIKFHSCVRPSSGIFRKSLGAHLHKLQRRMGSSEMSTTSKTQRCRRKAKVENGSESVTGKTARSHVQTVLNVCLGQCDSQKLHCRLIYEFNAKNARKSRGRDPAGRPARRVCQRINSRLGIWLMGLLVTSESHDLSSRSPERRFVKANGRLASTTSLMQSHSQSYTRTTSLPEYVRFSSVSICSIRGGQIPAGCAPGVYIF